MDVHSQEPQVGFHNLVLPQLENMDTPPKNDDEAGEAMDVDLVPLQSLFGGAQLSRSDGTDAPHQNARNSQPLMDSPLHDETQTYHHIDMLMISREPSPDFPRMSTEPDELEKIPKDDPIKAYGLRTNINRIVNGPCVDANDDTDFDPEQERRDLRKNAKRSKKPKEGKEAKKKEKERLTTANELKKRPKVIVKLPLGKKFNKGRRVTNDYSNWPENWSEDEYYQVPIKDPRGEYDDLTGHPEARGCKECRRLNQPCSTVIDGEWPCDSCINGRHQCEKIHNSHHERIDLHSQLCGPGRKHVECNACRSQKKKCSLEAKTDKPPCESCKNEETECVFYDDPAPTQKAKKTRKDAFGPLFATSSRVYKPDRKFFSASDLEEYDGSDTHTESVREPTPDVIMTDQYGNRGPVIKIKTSFAHPIQFHIDDDNDALFEKAASDCDFCNNPSFSFLGNFETMAYVLVWPTGKGYTELGNGHRQQGCENTVMCVDCCYSRLQIIACPDHNIMRIEDNVSLHQDFNGALMNLVDTQDGPKDQFRYQERRWCSFCMNLAKHHCCAPQESARDDNIQLIGCGLRLCDNCHDAFVGEFRGSIDSMATAYDERPKAEADSDDSPVGLVRADVGFLREHGQLWRNTGV
ncbi:unnamed protein product [Periconia digitata]|uniref:Zn(2)-C6 fungal-type domain-containing protein n=1 Tax=Periconia digitata TaxID=1303443 RepID=A0A9W4U4C2_9PLEO|nr:unnamed protein product [Periconia digitata]